MKYIIILLKDIRWLWLKLNRWLMAPIFKIKRFIGRRRMAKAGGEYLESRMDDRSATDFLETVLPPLEKKEE